MLWLRTLLFTLLVPGTVLGLVPLAFNTNRWGPRFDLGARHLIGFALILPALAMIVWCFIHFVAAVTARQHRMSRLVGWSSLASTNTSATLSTWA